MLFDLNLSTNTKIEQMSEKRIHFCSRLPHESTSIFAGFVLGGVRIYDYSYIRTKSKKKFKQFYRFYKHLYIFVSDLLYSFSSFYFKMNRFSTTLFKNVCRKSREHNRQTFLETYKG